MPVGLIAALAFASYTRLFAPDSAPSARYDPPLIYDAAGQSLLLFGGADPQNRNDLWLYSVPQKQWQELKPQGPIPAARFGHSTVYDPIRRRLILFGGQAGGFFSDVWAYDIAANQWTQLAPEGAGPSARYGHSAVYDKKRDRLVISHGFTTAGRFDDTWAFSLTVNQWTNVTPSGTRPLQRCLHHAAYDEANDQFLLFGGCSSGFGKCPQDDLWSFDLNRQTWTQLPGGPPARERYAMAFDSKRERLIIFGGSGANLLNDTWSYDVQAKAWTSLEATGDVPSPRSRVEGVYNDALDAVFWFGGSTDAGLSGELFRLDLAALGKIDYVVNAFSLEGGSVAPGELVSLFGSGLSQPVTFNGLPAAVSFASATQVNVRIPETLTAGTAASVASGNAITSLTVVGSRPGLFSTVFNADGSVNSEANPANPGGAVVVYATGIDAGQVRISLAATPAELVSAEALAGVEGVVRIEVRVPAVESGSIPLSILGGNSATVRIQPGSR